MIKYHIACFEYVCVHTRARAYVLYIAVSQEEMFCLLL